MPALIALGAVFFLCFFLLQIPSRLHICTIMSVWVGAEHFPSDFFVCQVLSPHHIEQVSWIALWMCFSKCLCLCLCTGHVMSYHHSNVKSPEFSQIFKIINKKSKLSKIPKIQYCQNVQTNPNYQNLPKIRSGHVSSSL